MTIIIKALSFRKCEGFIRLNPNVFCGLVRLLESVCVDDAGEVLLQLRFNEFKSVFNTTRIK